MLNVYLSRCLICQKADKPDLNEYTLDSIFWDVELSIIGNVSPTLGVDSDAHKMTCGNAITTTGTLYVGIDHIKTHRAILNTPTGPLEIAVGNLDSTAVNSYASRGRILGADYATETTELIRTQII